MEGVWHPDWCLGPIMFHFAYRQLILFLTLYHCCSSREEWTVGTAELELFALCKFNVHGFVHHNNILIYIQQDATLHSLFYLGTSLRISGGTITHHRDTTHSTLKPIPTLPR